MGLGACSLRHAAVQHAKTWQFSALCGRFIGGRLCDAMAIFLPRTNHAYAEVIILTQLHSTHFILMAFASIRHGQIANAMLRAKFLSFRSLFCVVAGFSCPFRCVQSKMDKFMLS